MKPVIYQLVVRYFGNTNRTNAFNGTLAQNGSGRFNDISDVAIDSLKKMGVTHVWLTGVLRQATLTDHSDIGLPADPPEICKGIAGSFYAVRDYFDVCSDYVVDPTKRLDEFKALVDRMHAAGLKVIIDLVSNHVSRDYTTTNPANTFGLGDDEEQFFARDNSFFYLCQPPGQRLTLPKPTGWNPPGIVFTGNFALEDGGPDRTPKATGNNVTVPDPDVSSWYETIKLNYGWNFVLNQGDYSPRPRTWTIIDQILGFWQSLGVDGFRCDFAHYVPAEAWTWLLAQARSRQPAYFFAEAYPNQGSGSPIQDPATVLVAAGFDAVYDSLTYEALKKLYLGWESIDGWADEVFNTQATRPHLVSYLENHDERRIASPVNQQSGGNGGESGFGSANAGYQLAPLQLLHSTNPVMLLNGQEVGEPGAGATGFKGDNGRTTFFDYWTMPVFANWVGKNTYAGDQLSSEEIALRSFYVKLLNLCQDPCIVTGSYWDLRYLNRNLPQFMPFARFLPGKGRLLLIVANLFPNNSGEGNITLGSDLMIQAGLAVNPKVNVLLGDNIQASWSGNGVQLSIPNQRTAVLELLN